MREINGPSPVEPPSNGSGSPRSALVRYIYIDIVDFSIGRTIEAQSEILSALNRIVGQSVSEHAVVSDQMLFLPTGDGICVCLVDLIHPFDLDISIAISVLERVSLFNRNQVDSSRRFELRIGINENQDNLVIDIKGGINVVGLGINLAHRVMSVASASGLCLGSSVFERLNQRELYSSLLKPVQAIMKHGERLQCYEYHNPELPCFNQGRSFAGGNQSTVKPPARAIDLPGRSERKKPHQGRQQPPPSFRIS